MAFTMTSDRSEKPARKPRRRKKIEFVEHLSGDEQMLITFPWTRSLTGAERTEFAEALANHPSDISNAQLESLILSWKQRALLAQSRKAA